MTNYLANSLDELASMKNNWDGRHGLAPTKQAIEVASVVCAIPLGSGGIQLELHAGGSDIEIEIGPTGVILGVSWTKARLP
jgi:hypothetical protein